MPKELTHFNSNYFNSYIELTLNNFVSSLSVLSDGTDCL